MMARTFYLPADTTIDLAAAKTTASQLCQQASLADLRTLREHGWIDDDTLPGLDHPAGSGWPPRLARAAHRSFPHRERP